MATNPFPNFSDNNLYPFIVAPIQAKLNRLILNGLLRGFPVTETGTLNPPTVSTLQRFCAAYAVDSDKSFAPWICHTPRNPNALPFLRPVPNPFALPPQPFIDPPQAYDPLPDLDPESTAMRVLQWLVDHSEGPISQMTPAAHMALAQSMLPEAKRITVEQNTPHLVRELLGAKARFKTDMDHTSMLLMSFATIAAEARHFIPVDEGANRKGPYNNTAYEDFDVYEPYFVYDPNGAEELIQRSREKALKEPGFHEPVRKPIRGSRAVEGNTDPGDGARFKGRGLIQLTHRKAYEDAGKALDLDLLEHPEKLNTIKVSAQAMVWWLATDRVLSFNHRVRPALEKNDTRTLREAVNGVAKPGHDPAGLSNFETAYWAGRRFLREGYFLMVNRSGLRSSIPGAL